MRATKHAGSGDGKYGLADTMKLVIAVVFVAIFALLNITEPKPHQANLAVTETAHAQAPAKAAATTATPAPVETPAAAEPTPAPQPEPVAPAAPAGTCQGEIAKYDWAQGTALAVSFAESGYDVNTLNDNPATGDYSVGCFQINIYGANARTRPSEAELKDPAVNVAWAYKLYASNGHSFIGQWGVCRNKVQCY